MWFLVLAAIVLLVVWPWLALIPIGIVILLVVLRRRKGSAPTARTNQAYRVSFDDYVVPEPPGPKVSTEKASKIVSIFTNKWANAAWEEFIVVDLETTGLYKGMDRIVEVAALRFRKGEYVDKYVTLVNPECKIPKPAMDVHGISDADVIGAPTIQTIMPELLSYLGTSVLVGHNANFDIGFIEVWARRCGYKPQWNYIDTVSVAKKMLPGLPNYKQTTILQHIGFNQDEYHRAEADCFGCAEIMLLALNSVVGA